MASPHDVSRQEWLERRRALLEREKRLTRLRDEVARERRALPRVRVVEAYRFEGPEGARTLQELFAGRAQLLVYHFMFGPEWTAGCPSCSFWADGFDGMAPHLAARDATLVAVSRAPYAALARYRQRMGWRFGWYSSAGSSFNFDYGVSFTPEQVESGAEYNYRPAQVLEELPGLSVFTQDDDGAVYHTYSVYSRGLDALNATYQHLDLLPRGRDEAELPWPMAWVRRHDEYGQE